MPNKDQEISLRIIVVAPPPGVLFAIQYGSKELKSQVKSTGADLSFEFTARPSNKEGSAIDFLGPYVQGRRGSRFVYVNSGTYAGQTDTSCARRAKISLDGITKKMIDDLKKRSGGCLEARITGTARDGGPVCASVPLLDRGWRVTSS
jgi:hypothetical protein